MKWINLFGLKDWLVGFYHKDWSDAYGDSLAWARWDQSGRIVSFCLAPDWEDILSIERLKRVAFHEVIHVMLGGIENLAEGRFVTQREIDEEIHAIIRRLENVIFF